MTRKRDLIQRTADLLRRLHPDTQIVALTDPDLGDVDDLSITAGDLGEILSAIARPAFIIEGNPSSADDIAKLVKAGVPSHIFPAPMTIEWLLDVDEGAIAIDRTLLAAAIREIREWKVAKGGDDQVALNLEAALKSADGEDGTPLVASASNPKGGDHG